MILGDAQREAIETAHFDLDDREVARHWTLSELDLLRVGWTPKRRDRVPLQLLQYVGEQLQIETDNVEEFFRRQPTRIEYLQEIMDLYGFRSYDSEVGEEIAIWMKAQAHHCTRRWVCCYLF